MKILVTTEELRKLKNAIEENLECCFICHSKPEQGFNELISTNIIPEIKICEFCNTANYLHSLNVHNKEHIALARIYQLKTQEGIDF